LALVFGAIEFGRAMMVCNTLTTAARLGARIGSLSSSANSNVNTSVVNELTANSLPPGSASIAVLVNGTDNDASTAVTGDRIEVTVSIPYASVSWLPAPQFLGSTQLSARAAMRRE
jgi:Flp pilus assembly protein TadG